MRKTPGSPIEHPTGIAAGRVLIGGLAGLTLAVCLNASSLLAEAKRLPDSASRSASLAVWTPLEAAASALNSHGPENSENVC